MKRKRIAVLIAGLNREYQREYTRGLAEEAAAQDADLCLFNTQGHVDADTSANELSESQIYDLPDLDSFDAIVALISTFSGNDTIQKITRRLRRYSHIPQLFIDFDSDYAATIRFDDGISFRALINHLLSEHQFRSFALVAGPFGNPVSDARMRVVQETIRSGGGTVPEGYILSGSWTRSSGYLCAQQLIQTGSLPDAIVCMNDDMALGVVEALMQHNIHVPEDICVTGFDGYSEAVGIGITTIRRPVVRAGHLTISTLLDWANGHPPEKRNLVLPTDVIYGSSCGCQPDSRRAPHFLHIMARQLYQMDQTLMRSSAFSSALFNVHEEHEAGRVITRFADSWDMKELHLCVMPTFLNPDPPTQPDAYSRQMLLLACHTQGKPHGQVLFSTSRLVPILDDEDRGPIALVFNPLYYFNRSFGYVVLDLAFASSLALYSLLPLLNGSLMNLNQQSTIRSYADAMESITMHDPLTGLINRRGYLHKATEMMELARREHRWFAVLSADMDGMKLINDRHGHQAGDQAICRMASAMRCLESEGMTCVHISGDEFIAIGLVDDAEGERILHDTLSRAIDDMNCTSPWICPLSASIGVYAAIPIAGEIPDDYLKRADRKMYLEKQTHHLIIKR